MHYTLRHLELFTAIALSENVSAGAERIGMSQSAASTALAELERRAGRPVFDRAGKRLHLNETGRLLLPAALRLLEQAREVDALLLGQGGPGPLKLGATVTIGNYLAPRLVEQYRTAHEGVEVDLWIGNTTAVAERLLAFELDLALIEGDYSHPDLLVSDWYDDELSLFCAPSHPLAAKSRCAIDDILVHGWAVRERGSGTRQSLDRAMAPYWSRWSIATELHQIEAIKTAVDAGRLIGCVSRLALTDALASGRLVELSVPELDLRRRFYTMVHRQKFMTTGMDMFLKSCLSADITAS